MRPSSRHWAVPWCPSLVLSTATTTERATSASARFTSASSRVASVVPCTGSQPAADDEQHVHHHVPRGAGGERSDERPGPGVEGAAREEGGDAGVPAEHGEGLERVRDRGDRADAAEAGGEALERGGGVEADGGAVGHEGEELVGDGVLGPGRLGEAVGERLRPERHRAAADPVGHAELGQRVEVPPDGHLADAEAGRPARPPARGPRPSSSARICSRRATASTLTAAEHYGTRRARSGRTHNIEHDPRTRAEPALAFPPGRWRARWIWADPSTAADGSRRRATRWPCAPSSTSTRCPPRCRPGSSRCRATCSTSTGWPWPAGRCGPTRASSPTTTSTWPRTSGRAATSSARSSPATADAMPWYLPAPELSQRPRAGRVRARGRPRRRPLARHRRHLAGHRPRRVDGRAAARASRGRSIEHVDARSLPALVARRGSRVARRAPAPGDDRRRARTARAAELPLRPVRAAAHHLARRPS